MFGGGLCLGQILRPSAAAIRLVDARQERRDHFSKLRQHLIGVILRFAQRVGAHAKQQRFVGLTRAEQTKIRLNGGRQQSAQRVERFRADRRAIDAVAIGLVLRKSRPEMILHRLDPAGVGLERAIERRREARLQRRAFELARDVIFPFPAWPVCVRHVARRLLEVRHQAAPLDHLRQNIRNAFARQMHAAQLRHGVVAVFRKHARVKLFGPFDADLMSLKRPMTAGRREIRRETAAAAISPSANTAQTERPSRFPANS